MQMNIIPKRFNRPFVITRKEKHRNKNVLLLCSDLSNELLELATPESIKLIELCDGKKTVVDILNILADELNMDVASIKNDVFKLLDVLERYRFIFYDDKTKYKPTMLGTSGRPFLDYLQKNGMTHFSAPLNVRFLTTLRCNGRCRYCYLSAGRTGLKRFRNEMTTEQIKKLMDQCDKFGAVSLGFMGGEPFLRKDAIELIEYSLKLKIFTPTSTNGIILSDEKIAKKLADIADKDLFSLQISIDGSKPEIHEYTRSGIKFEKVVKCIKNMVDYGVRINTNTVVTKANIKDIPDLVSMLDKLGVPEATFSEFMPVGMGTKTAESLLLPYSDYYNLQAEVIPKLQKKYRNMQLYGKMLEPEFWNEKRIQKPSSHTVGRCVAGTTDICIAPDGTVLPCAWFVLFPEFWAENALKKGIVEIWNNSKKLRMLRNVPIRGKCKHCEFSRSCYKGCHVLKWALHRDIHIPDPKCWYVLGDRKSIYPPKEVLETMKPSYRKDLSDKKETKR